jgi:hypothetical protein
MEEGKSLRLHERRPSNRPQQRIRVTAMRNDVDGRIMDVVSRDLDLAEVIPYRITEQGQLNIYVHEGLPRGIVNAVPRTGKEIDGKRWSGHMTEAIAVDTNITDDATSGGFKEVVKFARDYLGLKPVSGAKLEEGPTYFPAPDFIDERIQTRYLNVEKATGDIEPKNIAEDLTGFTTTGRIRELSAQSILNAIAVGFIPNARLELQIEALFHKLGMKAENWNETPLLLEEFDIEDEMNPQELMEKLAGDDGRYRNVRGTTGQFRPVQSIFVDEGRVQGGIKGLKSRDMEFIISDENTLNTAVVLPLARDTSSGEVMAGVQMDYLPVPQRYKGNGFTVRAPSFPLPKEITNVEQARQYIAEKYNVPTENVARLGESYFCHIGITPQRIFPFAVAPQGHASSGWGGGVTNYAPLRFILSLMYYDADDMLIFVLNRAYKTLSLGTEAAMTKDFSHYSAPQDTGMTHYQLKDASGLVNRAPPSPQPPPKEESTSQAEPAKPITPPAPANDKPVKVPFISAPWEAQPKKDSFYYESAEQGDDKKPSEKRRLDPK